MNLKEAISHSRLILATGTHEGAERGWDTRGRGRHTISAPTFNEKDIVRLNFAEPMWNEKTGNLDKFPAGKLKAVVVNVLPKIGVGDQMLKVNILPPTKNHESDNFKYVKATDVTLHKTSSEHIDVKPVPKSQVIQKYKSNDGANVTIVKSHEEQDTSPRTIKELANQPSRYKGQFDLVEKVAGADGNTTRFYDSTRNIGPAWKEEGPTAAYKPGQAVWVHRYEDHVTIQEQSYQRMGQKNIGVITWKYNNVGKAFGMMKKRYGISIPLSRERF